MRGDVREETEIGKNGRNRRHIKAGKKHERRLRVMANKAIARWINLCGRDCAGRPGFAILYNLVGGGFRGGQVVGRRTIKAHRLVSSEKTSSRGDRPPLKDRRSGRSVNVLGRKSGRRLFEPQFAVSYWDNRSGSANQLRAVSIAGEQHYGVARPTPILATLHIRAGAKRRGGIWLAMRSRRRRSNSPTVRP